MRKVESLRKIQLKFDFGKNKMQTKKEKMIKIKYF